MIKSTKFLLDFFKSRVADNAQIFVQNFIFSFITYFSQYIL